MNKFYIKKFDVGLGLVKRYFDPEYYRVEYPDLQLSDVEAILHYSTIGWQEGRNPHSSFDTVSYMLQSGTYMLQSGVETNPLIYHFRSGINEGRVIFPSVTPSVRTLMVFGRVYTDWVGALRPHVDVDFYRKQAKLDPSVDPVAHFSYRGWRELRPPNPALSIQSLLQNYPRAAALLVNPLLAHLESCGAI